MRRRLRSYVPILVTALVTASLTATGPSIAAAVQKALFAKNSDKVDGIHAQEYTNKAPDRAKKLLATNGKGRLPNNIIKKAPNAAKLKGLAVARLLDHDANTLVVDPSGNGDAKTIQAAIDAAAPGPDDPYRILILPGTYTEKVILKPFIDLEGVGMERPIIRCECGATSNVSFEAPATLAMADPSTVKNVIVQNSGTSSYAYAISATSDDNALVDVKAAAGGAAEENAGISVVSGRIVLRGVESTAVGGTTAYGVRAEDSNVDAIDSKFTAASADGDTAVPHNRGLSFIGGNHTLSNVRIVAAGRPDTRSSGIYQENASMTMSDSRIRAVGSSHEYFGIENDSSDATVTDSVIEAGGGAMNWGIFNVGEGTHTVTVERSSVISEGTTIFTSAPAYTVHVATTRLDGLGVEVNSGSTMTCAFTYTETFTPVTGPDCA